jgi:hypothetical protein
MSGFGWLTKHRRQINTLRLLGTKQKKGPHSFCGRGSTSTPFPNPSRQWSSSWASNHRLKWLSESPAAREGWT